MIGKTNCTQFSSIPIELVNITLSTNQSDHSDLNDATLIVSYETFREEYIWIGSEITVRIPSGVQYSIEFSNIKGYKTPDTILNIAEKDKVSTINAVYQTELCTINVSSDNGEINGYEITIYELETVGVSSKYTLLDYIESTGTLYIDTGFKMNQDTTVAMRVQATSITANAWAFEGRTSNDNASKGVFYYYGSTKLWSVDYNGSGNRKSINGVGATDMLEIEYNKNICTINGVSVTNTASTFQSDYNLVLLAANTTGTISGYLKAKLYSCKIYDNDTLIRDYIPAMNDSGVAGLYDAVNDTFTISSGSSDFLAGAKNEEVVATQTSATGTYEIPFGQGYTIQASDVSGYTTPSTQIFVASESERMVNITYMKIVHGGTTNPTNGIWIQDTDGYCHTTEEWTGEYTPNGIAVVTDYYQFVIALEDAYGYCTWGSYNTTVNNIVTTTYDPYACDDRAGESNTTTILNQLGNSSSTDDAPAAYYCRAFTFPNGKVGYLGAAGEWYIALYNRSAITTALSKVGGTAMFWLYWTSTQYDSELSWSVNWGNGGVTYDVKSYENYVRAFTSF